MHGADMRIVAVTANRLNQVFLTILTITSFKQLKGKRLRLVDLVRAPFSNEFDAQAK
jgi:hypothetical protein